MIKEADLLEAIAECQGRRNPDANTAIKLAAYYTIMDHMNAPDNQPSLSLAPGYSFANEPSAIEYDGDSEFARLINGRNQSEVWPVMDELMATIKVTNTRLYGGVIRKLR